MKMEASVMRDKTGDEIEKISPDVYHLTIWYSKVKDWNILRSFKNLQLLKIAGYDGDSIEPITALKNLESLHLLHFPKLASISGIEELKNLKELWLHSLPSWDASNKKLVIDSFNPLKQLKHLTVVNIVGVNTRDGSNFSNIG
jgi:hypothetical protein